MTQFNAPAVFAVTAAWSSLHELSGYSVEALRSAVDRFVLNPYNERLYVSQALLPSLGLRHCAVTLIVAPSDGGTPVEFRSGRNAEDFLFDSSKACSFQLGFHPAPEHGVGAVELRNFALVATGLEGIVLTQMPVPEPVAQDTSVTPPCKFNPKDCYDASETSPEKVHQVTQHWIATAAHFSRDADYYRGLLEQTARLLGPEVCRQDDGNLLDEPLLSKVPDVVAAWARERQSLQSIVSRLTHLSEFHANAAVPAVVN